MEKNNKGITLIALVITVIVLLILAGVAISMLSGENGILKQAANAKERTEKASTDEQVKLAVLSAMSNAKHNVDYSILNKELKEVGYNGEEIRELPKEIDVKGNRYRIEADGTANRLVWYYTDDKKITNGKITLELGDKINYTSGVDDKEKEQVEEDV